MQNIYKNKIEKNNTETKLNFEHDKNMAGNVGLRKTDAGTGVFEVASNQDIVLGKENGGAVRIEKDKVIITVPIDVHLFHP